MRNVTATLIGKKDLKIFDTTNSSFSQCFGKKSYSRESWFIVKANPIDSSFTGLESEHDSIFKARETLRKISAIDELLEYGKKIFPKSKLFLLELIQEELKSFLEEEDSSSNEGREVQERMIGSLKSMLLFLFALKRFKEPEISVGESGLFYLDWEEELDNSLTVRFKNDFMLDYSLFQPSAYANKLTVRNGKLPVLDFKNDLSRLNIKLHKEI